MYGLFKRLVTENIGLSPKERAFYLSGKLYYEPDELTTLEKEEIYPVGINLSSDIEFEYLSIKYQREEATEEEKKCMMQFLRKKELDDMNLLDKYLKETGSSLNKLAKENIDSATNIFIRINHYKERHFNVVGQTPIYLNINRYLHVYMRHVDEMKINKHFEHKTNFQWQEIDVLIVIKKVIEKINDDIQHSFENNPGKRYSLYGKKSVYFGGDYYTIHIEANGSISTFYKNRKTDEKTL